MTARIKISQAGLAAGVAGRSRTDGLATGALVTLEDVSGTGIGLSTFHLLWCPVEDTTAASTLAVTGGDLDVWTFSPMAAAYGSYQIELRVSGVPVERRIFGIRTPANQLLIPALNERASRHASRENAGADQIDLAENNANDFPLSALNSFRYAGWWRSLYELYRIVELGTGSIADHAVALIKLATAPAKSVIANATNASGNAAYFSPGRFLQSLRNNAANNALEWAGIGTAVEVAAGSLTNSTASLDLTAGLAIPAGGLVVGSRFAGRATYRFTRGATATALALNAALEVGATSLSAAAASAQTVNGFSGTVTVLADFTVVTTGAGGTARANIMTITDCDTTATAGKVVTAFNATFAIDTTAALTMKLRGSMGTAVANATILATGGHILPVAA